MTLATTPVEALEMGLQIINEKGWIQDKMIEPATGSVCSLGAISVVVKGVRRNGYVRRHAPKGSSGILKSARFFLTEAVVSRKQRDSLFGDPIEDVVAYNDEPGRTAAQIKSLFRTAISLAKKAAQA